MIPDPPSAAGGTHLVGISGDSKPEMFGRVGRSDEDTDMKGGVCRCGLEKRLFPPLRQHLCWFKLFNLSVNALKPLFLLKGCCCPTFAKLAAQFGSSLLEKMSYLNNKTTTVKTSPSHQTEHRPN